MSDPVPVVDLPKASQTCPLCGADTPFLLMHPADHTKRICPRCRWTKF